VNLLLEIPITFKFEEVAPTMRQYNKKLQTKTLLQVMIEEYRSLQLNLDLLNHQFQPRASNLISMVIEAARALRKAKAKYSHTLIMIYPICLKQTQARLVLFSLVPVLGRQVQKITLRTAPPFRK
jgi:hypothetical protein